MNLRTTRHDRLWTHLSRLQLAGCLTLLAACSGGGGGAQSNDLDHALVRLGIDTTTTPRRDSAGQDIPAAYTPFGASWEPAKTSELLFIGLNTGASGRPVSLLDVTDDDGNAASEVLDSLTDAQAPWARETLVQSGLPATLRGAVAADVDGDGLEDALIVYMDGSELHVVRIDDEPSAFATVDHFVGLEQGVTNLAACAADLDGDGRDEVVLGLTENGDGLLVFLRATANGFQRFGPRVPFVRSIPGSTLWMQIASGNVDHDRSAEIALTVNEERRTPAPVVQSTRFAVLDDATANFAGLLEGAVQGHDQSAVLRMALVASPALGDVDGDGMDEVLLGGLTRFGANCDGGDYFLLALDDAEHGFLESAGRFLTHTFNDCDSPNNPRVRSVHLNALDIDGDGRAEVQANLFVFQDFVEAAPWTEVVGWRLPETVLYSPADVGWYDITTSLMIAGEFTGDGREDIAVYRQDTGEIGIWGVAGPQLPGTTSKLRSLPVTFENSQFPCNPVLVPVNIDTDSAVLKYDAGESKLVFSEPIVLAAMAAAPYRNGIGQNVDACQTTFGNTESTSTESERTVSVTAKACVGVSYEDEITQSGFDLKAELSAKVSQVTTEAYNLSKTILFTSGASEDLVVFTSIPLDQYTYTIVSHPDPALIGQKVVVNLPRDPITMQAERGFYNDTIPAGSMKIDASVFHHTIGEPTSYPTRTDKDIQLVTSGGLQVGPVGVGQGSGSTQVTLEVGEEIGAGHALELGFEINLEVTLGGFVAGLSVGASQENTFKVTSGEQTTYQGTVGAIDAAHFADNHYAFGLYTYVQRDPATGREFEVLNYWVE